MAEKSPRGVLPDLDGALIDSNAAHARVTALAMEGFDTLSRGCAD